MALKGVVPYYFKGRASDEQLPPSHWVIQLIACQAMKLRLAIVAIVDSQRKRLEGAGSQFAASKYCCKSNLYGLAPWLDSSIGFWLLSDTQTWCATSCVTSCTITFRLR